MGFEAGILAGLFLGVFFEGEWVFISAVIAAHHDHINLWPVLLVSYAATVTADLVYFSIGRSRGAQWISHRKFVHKRIEKTEKFMENNELLIHAIFRFVSGVRIIAPLLMGMRGMAPGHFVLMSLAGSLFWSAIIAGLGIVAGESIIQMLGHLKDVEVYIIALLVIVAIIIAVKKFHIHLRPSF